MRDLTLAEYEKIQPMAAIEYAGKKIRYRTPTQHTYWRCQSLFTKEPDTIAWIATFQPHDIFLDIGANVGMYTIWAAATRGCTVYAFEPEAHNYALLNQNIAINQLGDRVLGFCMAIGNQTKFDKLYLSHVSPGGSCHTFGDALNFQLQPFEPAFAQGCFAMTLDGLVQAGVIPQPTHIKIDVDGLEHQVVAGAQQVLRHSRLHSVLLEMNRHLEAHQALHTDLLALGFTTDPQQMEMALRTEGTFAGIGNVIYTRTPPAA